MHLHDEAPPAAREQLLLNGHATKIEKQPINGELINNNDNPLTELESRLRLRNGGSGQLNGRLSPVRRELSPSRRELSPARRELSPSRRELSPSRNVVDYASQERSPESVYDRLKILSSSAQAAQDSLSDLQTNLKATLREARYAQLSSPSAPLATSTPQSNGKQQEKEFRVRNALLTDLFAISHIATIYHIAVVVLIVLVLNTVVHDFSNHGTVQLGLGLIWHAFGGFHRVITIWLVMFLSVCLLYACFSYWTERRRQISNPLARRCLDWSALAALVLYYVALLALPMYRLQMYDMKIASSVALCMESVRLLMKSHAFVRSNVPRALGAQQPPLCPGFSQFLYYLFAPTLIYRDTYPRTAVIRWRVVACHALEVAGVIFYLSFLCERYLMPLYRDFGKEVPTVLQVLEILAAGLLPSGMTFVCSFYLLLHSWQNAFAEMLRFGDRLFYKDWWNQTTFSSFYRTWNTLVQDWLFTYVYKDVRMLGGSNFTAKLSVFVISAIVHEFILSFTFGFFYPVLYVLFGVIGTVFGFMRYRHSSQAVGNIFLWFSMFAGSSILFGLYSVEYFARQNCARILESSWDLFIPRSCNCVPL